MNRMKLKIGLVLLCILLIGCSFLLDAVAMIRPAELAAPTEGVPTVVKRKNDLLCTGISQIVADEDRIYVLFGTYSVVQAYTAEGEYLYSVSVYNHSNGGTQIAAKDGCLYIRDKRHNLYILSDGKLIEYLEDREADSAGKNLKFGASDSGYTMKKGSVWRIADDTCVLQRPDWLVIYQGSLNWLVKAFLMITVGFLLNFPIPKKKQESTP